MKNLLLALIMLLPTQVHAIDVYVFGGFFAYSDAEVMHDYKGLSPNGYFGVKATHTVDDTLSVSFGFKHESSTGYQEVGPGFEGVFLESQIKVF